MCVYVCVFRWSSEVRDHLLSYWFCLSWMFAPLFIFCRCTVNVLQQDFTAMPIVLVRRVTMMERGIISTNETKPF
jgi:hypothetical protein